MTRMIDMSARSRSTALLRVLFLLILLPSPTRGTVSSTIRSTVRSTTTPHSPSDDPPPSPWGPSNPVADPQAIFVPPPSQAGDHDKSSHTNLNLRFTFLTDRLIRIEQGPGEDRATLAVINRRVLPVPKVKSQIRFQQGQQGQEEKVWVLSTDYLELRYTLGQPLNENTLQVKGRMSPLNKDQLNDYNNNKNNASKQDSLWIWRYNVNATQNDPGNLLGTIRTLDGANIVNLNCTTQDTSSHCEYGLISRTGFALVDDSQNWALKRKLDDGDQANTGFGKSEWWDDQGDNTNGQNVNQVDLYLFGHGHDYKAALSDYRKIGGYMPLLPRYAWGHWFSRWYDYNSASAYNDIVQLYQQYSLPLDVVVLDMNWHSKDDWTGYSWDPHLYQTGGNDAIARIKQHPGLAVTLNLHDANGMNSWETRYTDYCRAIGQDPTAATNIPFSIVNRTTLLNLEDIVLRPMEEEDGVDFWWIDWQQGEAFGGGDGNKRNPTIWTAHVRSTDHYRRQEQARKLPSSPEKTEDRKNCGSTKRAMVLARWGGLGAHRYPVHFSGDAAVGWEQLSFQPYFSMTATNVGAVWSHDISGWQSDPELLVRWLQWSVLSGVSRLHDKGMSAGKCAQGDRETCSVVEPWKVSSHRFAHANYEAIRLRGSWIPYIYTAAYQAHAVHGRWFVLPLYYEWPELDGAYQTAAPPPYTTQGEEEDGEKFGPQYMFGDDMMVAPIVQRVNQTDGLARSKIWIPPGAWVGMLGGQVVQGCDDGTSAVQIKVDLEEIPVFAKDGSIIPSIPVRPGATLGLAMKQYHELVWTVALSASPPESGMGLVYEDDAATTNYLSGSFALTRAKYKMQSIEPSNDSSLEQSSTSLNQHSTTRLSFFVTTEGTFEELPAKRFTTIRFVNTFPPSSVQMVSTTNTTIPFSRFGGEGTWSYDINDAAVVVELEEYSVHDDLHVEIETIVGDTTIGDALAGLGFKTKRALAAKATLDETRSVHGSQTGQMKSDAYLLSAASLGSALEAVAGCQKCFKDKLLSFGDLLKGARDEVQSMLNDEEQILLDGPPPEGAAVHTRGLHSSGRVNQQLLNRAARAFALLDEVA